nr:hypothetical protein [Tanacetum cinerariifolium]
MSNDKESSAAGTDNRAPMLEENDYESWKILPQLEGHIKTNKDLSRANESLKAELAQCKLVMQSLERNKVKHDLEQAIVERNKRNAELEQEKSLLKTTLFNKEESIEALNEKNKKVVSEKKDLDERNLEEIVCLQKANMKELSREQVYWQSVSAVKALFVHTRPAKMCTAGVRMPLNAKISSSYVRELSKVLELEAEIAKNNKMLSESEKRYSHIEKDYIDLEIKFQEYRDCFKSLNVCDNSQSPAYNAFFKINKLKDQLQGKDITIKQLQTQLKDATIVQVGPTAGSLDKQALKTEITQLKDKLTSVNIQLNGYKIEN